MFDNSLMPWLVKTRLVMTSAHMEDIIKCPPPSSNPMVRQTDPQWCIKQQTIVNEAWSLHLIICLVVVCAGLNPPPLLQRGGEG